MLLVDEETVRELIQSHDADAALVFTGGRCVIVSLGETAVPDTGMLIARRHEITTDAPGSALPDDRIHTLACCLDNRARDMGT